MIMETGNGVAISRDNPAPIENVATDAVAVTPNDSADLASKPTKGVYVGVSGDIKITLQGGSTASFVGLAAGVIHPIAAMRIWATGTTATSILAVY